jgi:hypothetical protein
MVLNAPPTLMRIITQPEDSPMLAPHELAGWWVAGRAERTQHVDSAHANPNSQAVRASLPRWSKLRRTKVAKSAATPGGTQSRFQSLGSEAIG